MSTAEDQDGYFPGFFTNDTPEIGPIAVLPHPDPGVAVISLGKPGTIYFRSAALARELLKAAAEAVAILDPPLPDLTVRPAFVPGFQPAAPVPEPECERCGVTVATGGVLVTSDGVTRCHNHPNCDVRVAARDAEAAQRAAS